MKRLLVLAVLALASPACGGGDSGGTPRATASADPRAQRETRLEQTSIGICNGACLTYHATVATCSGDGTELEGRTYYPCRVEYETKAGHTPAPDEICASLDEVRGHVVRPPTDCR